MNITIKNQVPGTRSYLGGIVTVAENSSTLLPRDFNVVIVSDAQFLSDTSNSNIMINNGVQDLSPGEALLLYQVLGQYSTDPVATIPLYYSLPVNIRQTATTALGTTVWSMRNPLMSPVSVVIENIHLVMTFDALIPIPDVLLRYELARFNSATPSGGTAVAVIKNDSLSASSAISARCADTGLTVDNVVFEPAFAIIGCPAVAGSTVRYERVRVCTKLAPGEGLAIRINSVDAAVSQSLTGEINWSLR